MATMLWTGTSCVSLSMTGEELGVTGPAVGKAPGPQALFTYKGPERQRPPSLGKVAAWVPQDPRHRRKHSKSARTTAVM